MFYVDSLRMISARPHPRARRNSSHDEALYVQAGDGVVALADLRDATGARLSFKDFVAAYQPAPGMNIEKGNLHAY